MSELPDLSAQKPYALDQLAQLQGKIIQLSKSMVLQRARIERCRQSDLAAARDIYAELSRTRETLVETLAQARLFLMEMEEYALAKVSGQLRQGLAGFALMSTGYKSVYEALSRFASSLPVGQKTNAAVVGRLMNNIRGEALALFVAMQNQDLQHKPCSGLQFRRKCPLHILKLCHIPILPIMSYCYRRFSPAIYFSTSGR